MRRKGGKMILINPSLHSLLLSSTLFLSLPFSFPQSFLPQHPAHLQGCSRGRTGPSRVTTMAAAHGGGVGSGAALCRRWEDLSHDLLVSIFSRLGVEDLIADVPYVCKAWRDAAMDRACWHSFDFRDWMTISRRLGCRRDPKLDFADLIRFCVSRANQDSIDSIHFPPFAGEEDLLFVAHRCPGLLYFSLDSSDVNEDKFCEAISKTERLTGMAVHENLITEEVLGHVNRCCSGFSELKIFADAVDEIMACIICECLPHLRKLEAMDCTIPRRAVLQFLDELKDLEYLDISGYESSGITGIVLEKASRLKVFHWNSRFQGVHFDYCSDCGEDWIIQCGCPCAGDWQYIEWLATLDQLLS